MKHIAMCSFGKDSMAKAELTIEIRDLEEVKNELKAKDQRIAELEEQLKNATKQVRKEVCEGIRNKIEQAKLIYEWKGKETTIEDILDQLQEPQGEKK